MWCRPGLLIHGPVCISRVASLTSTKHRWRYDGVLVVVVVVVVVGGQTDARWYVVWSFVVVVSRVEVF